MNNNRQATEAAKTHVAEALRLWCARYSNSTSMMRCRHSEYRCLREDTSLFTLLNSEIERRSCLSGAAPSAPAAVY